MTIIVVTVNAHTIKTMLKNLQKMLAMSRIWVNTQAYSCQVMLLMIEDLNHETLPYHKRFYFTVKIQKNFFLKNRYCVSPLDYFLFSTSKVSPRSYL